MTSSCIMKQLREKHVSAEIFKCLWSPKMDLIAIANFQGQVVLHRLSWQQVWSLSPPKENIGVTALAWRPDSKVLAVGYASGKVLLLNVEDGSAILDLDLKKEITVITWAKYSNSDDSAEHKDKLQDIWSEYSYTLPPLSKSFNEAGNRVKTDFWQEPRLLQGLSELNVLCIGVVNCSLHLYAFGLLHMATIDLSERDPFASRIVNIVPSSSMDFFSLIFARGKRSVGADGDGELLQLTVESSLISCRYKELHALTQKYGQIHSIMTYINHTLLLIEEAWDSALIEMDARLADYAASLPEGSVSADFMDLLVFGHTSATFEVFLTTKLTETNLKKLRHSFDLCYNTMQRLVVKHLQQAGVSLVFLLSQVQGMSKRKEKFETLGVREEDVAAALGSVGSFLLKVTELLQAIESSMKDFHVFVRWVTNVHLRLQREHVPSELSRISQQEATNLLSFLSDSLEEVVTGSDGEARTHFRLERTGQYLKNEELKMLPRSVQTPFSKLLESSQQLSSHPLIFKHNPRKSLIMEHHALTESLTEMGKQPGIAISDSLQVGASSLLSKLVPGITPAVTQVPLAEGTVGCAIIASPKQCSDLQITEWSQSCEGFAKAASFSMDGTNGPPHDLMTMLDTQFYTPETLSLLLSEPAHPRNPTFAQVSFQDLRSELGDIQIQQNIPISSSEMPRVNISLMPDAASLRRLETGLAASIAVSGPRKVAAVVGDNRRRIRIYEMGTEEDDEDDDDEFNDTKDDSVVNISANTDDLNDATL